MMYARAQGIDFDSWETPGWSAEEMIPLCNKLEKYCDDEPGIDKSKHGFDGPVHVSDGGFRAETANSFMATVKSMGMKEIADIQDFSQIGGFSVCTYLKSKVQTGKRMAD
jgi:choline dehydrogenase-like flavoprotein